MRRACQQPSLARSMDYENAHNTNQAMKSKIFVLLLPLAALPAVVAAGSRGPSIQMAPPAAGLPALPAVVKQETPAEHDGRLKWFREARFGIFIHWGVYAVPARGEWSCKARAASSFPVPVSPVTSTVISVQATFASTPKRRLIGRLEP